MSKLKSLKSFSAETTSLNKKELFSVSGGMTAKSVQSCQTTATCNNGHDDTEGFQREDGIGGSWGDWHWVSK